MNALYRFLIGILGRCNENLQGFEGWHWVKAKEWIDTPLGWQLVPGVWLRRHGTAKAFFVPLTRESSRWERALWAVMAQN